jgi:hypothetical protein
VQRAAIEALRFNGQPGAARLLVLELDKGLLASRDEQTNASLIRALCQKAETATLPVLQKLEIDPNSREVTRAWVLGLGRLRDPGAVATLMGFLVELPEAGRRLHMNDVRTSMMVLTGVDQGLDAEAWLRWWQGSGDTLKVRPFAPRLPGLVEIDWYGYWEIDPEQERLAQLKRMKQGEAKGEKPSADVPTAPTEAEQKPEPKSRRNPQANDWPADGKE